MSAPRSYNIAAYLERQAAARPFQRGVVFPSGRDGRGRLTWSHLTFQDLNALADDYARGFSAQGLKRGDRVSLFVRPSLDFIPLVFALFKIGALPVLIDPGMGRQQLLSCLARVKPRALIAEPIVHALRALFRRAFKSVEIRITVGRKAGIWGGVPLDACRISGAAPFEAAHVAADEEAAILFTSGSTGPAKGVTYTHGIFDAQARHIQAMYGIEGGEIDLACFPLFGLFSMAMGATVIIPEMDPTKPAQADPRKLIEAIQTQGCTTAFGSPAIWKNVALRCTREGIKLPSLKRIMMAGAPVPLWMHEAFYHEILTDGAALHAPYGATEALPIASLSSREILQETAAATREGAGVCVGEIAPGIALRVIEISDAPIADWGEAREVPQGVIGEICVRGEVVTYEYKDEPAHTAAAKIKDGEGIWHRMGDVGYLDADNRLWFCGRKAHRVKLAEGGELYSVPCEAIFNEDARVYRSALVGVDGEPVIIIELEPDVVVDKAELASALLKRAADNPKTARIKRLLYHPAFPVDVRHNAKIHR
ncbi:AMP-binding protein, partial [Myxococcota bacterium]|nr:AMP-binding protein [Myxococcota bacterium]